MHNYPALRVAVTVHYVTACSTEESVPEAAAEAAPQQLRGDSTLGTRLPSFFHGFAAGHCPQASRTRIVSPAIGIALRCPSTRGMWTGQICTRSSPHRQCPGVGVPAASPPV